VINVTVVPIFFVFEPRSLLGQTLPRDPHPKSSLFPEKRADIPQVSVHSYNSVGQTCLETCSLFTCNAHQAVTCWYSSVKSSSDDFNGKAKYCSCP